MMNGESRVIAAAVIVTQPELVRYVATSQLNVRSMTKTNCLTLYAVPSIFTTVVPMAYGNAKACKRLHTVCLQLTFDHILKMRCLRHEDEPVTLLWLFQGRFRPVSVLLYTTKKMHLSVWSYDLTSNYYS